MSTGGSRICYQVLPIPASLCSKGSVIAISRNQTGICCSSNCCNGQSTCSRISIAIGLRTTGNDSQRTLVNSKLICKGNVIICCPRCIKSISNSSCCCSPCIIQHFSSTAYTQCSIGTTVSSFVRTVSNRVFPSVYISCEVGSLIPAG